MSFGADEVLTLEAESHRAVSLPSTTWYELVITEDSVIVIADDLTSANLQGEAVILNLKSGSYFGVNEVGARILELVKEPVTVSAILSILSKEYDVDREMLETDVVGFLREMQDQHLIQVTNGTAA